MEFSHNQEIQILQQKFQNLLENNINRLKTDQNGELQKSKQSEERLKITLNELEKRVNNEYLQKSEHYQIVADLESLIETLKNEIEEKIIITNLAK